MRHTLPFHTQIHRFSQQFTYTNETEQGSSPIVNYRKQAVSCKLSIARTITCKADGGTRVSV